MTDAGDPEFPSLFRHQSRADWGVGVLSGERDGKRRYLFEGGEERTMGASHEHLMHKVLDPDREQQATYVRLTALLAKREGREPPAGSKGTKAIREQLGKLRLKHPDGFRSDSWQSDSQNGFALRAREGAARQAQHDLSVKAFDQLAKAKRMDSAWTLIAKLLNDSGLLLEELSTTSNSDHQLALGEAVRELLHSANQYDRRFDRFVTCYEAAFKTPPSWQTATALPALSSPMNHVYVDPVAFRKQLKALSRPSTLAVRPNGTMYLRCLGMARAVASALASEGEVPTDLFEVVSFIRATL